MPNSITESQVESLIDKAFVNVPRPDSVTSMEDIGCEDYEKQAINEFFFNRSREDINVNSLSEEYPGDYSAILFFMTEEGILYYLPQFMKLCIQHYDEVDVLPESLIVLFAGGRSGEEKEWLGRILAKLSNEQKAAIFNYLNYFYE